ncbi:MAG TPA: TonB-dependent receptor [Stellaceae bacterium]|nr:TonB-dependent receptor [Stellaceae bacterium]
MPRKLGWTRREAGARVQARIAVLGALALSVGIGAAAHAQSVEELRNLTIAQLGQVNITSVSLRPEPLGEAAAAVYVITADEIRRSGALTLPEILRLAPNLEVARVNSQAYAISSRGFNSVNASNKLLVLIDGRSIYTPFFSSVFWDQQQILPENIERIEVVSGPGGTLWGSNAVNGVINIITKNSHDTQGGLLDLAYGSFDKRGAGQWGGKIGSLGTYRAYALGFGEGDTRLVPSHANAMDSWNGKQAGFRSDLNALGGALTVQGDAYENLIDTPGGRNNGGNFTAFWNRRLDDGSRVLVEAYYDKQDRAAEAVTGGGTSDNLDTFDARAQHNFSPWPGHNVVWGGGERVWHDRFTNTSNPFVLIPAAESISLTNIFGQDTITLNKDLKLTLGSKFEYSTFSGFEVMPSARLGWRASPGNFFWLAVSRAVRPPSRLDRELQAPGITVPSPEFRSEKVVAYEGGWRATLAPNATISTSLFLNHYEDLRITAPSPSGGLPAMLTNGMEGDTYGAEFWADYRPLRWLRLQPGVDLLRENLHVKPGETDIASFQTSAGHDPGHQFFLKAYIDLPHNLDLFVAARQIGALDNVPVGSYFEMDASLGWHITPRLELSITGLNLLHASHVETFNTPGTTVAIPRSVYARLRVTF